MKNVKKTVIKTATNVGDKITSNPKTAIYVAIALGIVYAVFKVKSALSPTDINITDPPNVTVQESNTTITQEQASTFAQQLLNAMDRWGTDENTIYTIFSKLATADDFKMIYKAFGSFYYDGVGIPTFVFGNETKRDLVYWLKSELSKINSPTYKAVKTIIDKTNFIF